MAAAMGRKRKLKFWALLLGGLALLLGMGMPAHAQTPADKLRDPALEQALEEQLDSIGLGELQKSLPPDTQELLEEMDLAEIGLGELLSLTPGDFVRVLWRLLRNTLRQPLSTLGGIIGVVVLCALADTLKNGVNSAALSPVFAVISVLCVITAIAGPISECILGAAQALRECGTFMLSFIPAFATVVTVGGAPVTATTYNLLLFSACQLVSSFASTVLVPFMGIYMGLCIAGSVGEDMGVLPLAKGVRSFVTWSLTLLMTCYVGLLSMQTLVSVGADSAMLKAGKFLIGSFVPIVGSAISDALSAAQGAVHLLKTVVGAFGIVAGALTFLPILIKVMLWYLTLKAGAFVSGVLRLKKLGGLLEACSDCMGTMVAMLVSFMLLIIVSILLMLSFSASI